MRVRYHRCRRSRPTTRARTEPERHVQGECLIWSKDVIEDWITTQETAWRLGAEAGCERIEQAGTKHDERLGWRYWWGRFE